MISPSTQCSTATHRGARGLAVSAMLSLMLVAIAATAILPTAALAQDQKDAAKAADVFDDEKKPGETKPRRALPPKPPAVTDRDSIGFTQENVAAQMNELEERMFRLSEALRGLEPENASRLKLALKFSREELILNQMKETQKLLKEAQLSKAETEVRETAGEARTPPQAAAGRRPRFPDEAGAAAADARGPQSARSHHQGRTSRAGLVAHGCREAR